ncbi:hypothetical protein Ahy_A02g009188 [Arachis hypogaea]|uniref:Ribosome-recycling factor, chloroplastic n=1 Tax=Arachis hypogaea TaxID=3818 RepID=A0A445EGB2_ARAHY|nr:hypothetical protein Ahy_A02g009188 [Arachis hypogaea]
MPFCVRVNPNSLCPSHNRTCLLPHPQFSFSTSPPLSSRVRESERHRERLNAITIRRAVSTVTPSAPSRRQLRRAVSSVAHSTPSCRQVEYYGSPVSLKSIAQISTADASSLLVQPYDKSNLKAIKKAIVSSDVGMTPNNDGEVIRLTLPQLTSERRKVFSISNSFLNEIPYHSPFLMEIIV